MACLHLFVVWPLCLISWIGCVILQISRDLAKAGRRFRYETPLGQARAVAVALMLLGGASLLGVLVFPNYDRALVLTGRTEVLSMRLDNRAFGALDFGAAILRPDLDTPASERGPLQLDVAPGATIRFVRIGHGAMRLSFAAGAAASGEGCGAGLRYVGTAALAGVTVPLCEGAAVLVPLTPGDDPLVVGLSGGLVVGEEVSQGAGPRPILLDATASLFVRHAGPVFQLACGLETFEHLCDRFVANSLALAPGNSVRASGHIAAQGGPALHGAKEHPETAQADGGVRLSGLGFVRADPNEVQSGMVFNLAAPANAFEVTRIEGETFTIKENLFDVIEKSSLMRTLTAISAAAGLLWYFLRLRRGGEGAAAVLLCLLLGAPAPAGAQQAMLKVNDEIGQAMLRARGDRCYAITPAHVMGTETAALVTAPGRERGEGDLLRRIPAAPEPVALLTLHSVPLSLCPAFEGAMSLDSLLQNRSAAILRLVRSDGSIDRLPLFLASVETETVEVRTGKDATLLQGMSGGTVLIGDQPIGLLVDVLDEGHTGRVMRLDRIFERLAPHLGSIRPDAAPVLAKGTVAYEILRSNSSPIEPANRASSLQGKSPGPWRVRAAGRVELLLKASGPVSSMTLDVTGLPDPPRTVELLAGRTENGPWQPSNTVSLEPGDTVQSRRLSAGALPFFLLRAYKSEQQDTLALKSLTFLPR